jgi:hypothetical protein
MKEIYQLNLDLLVKDTIQFDPSLIRKQKINIKINFFLKITFVRVSSRFEPVKSKSAIPSLSIFNKSIELYEGLTRHKAN